MPDESVSSSMIHVLLVDDHDILRQGLKMLLSMQQGIKVVGEARSGQEAIVMAKKRMPDVVVMDITMPNMDGLVACQLIRDQQPATQVLMLTMHESEEYFLQALRMGAAGYLVKKFETRTTRDHKIANTSNQAICNTFHFKKLTFFLFLLRGSCTSLSNCYNMLLEMDIDIIMKCNVEVNMFRSLTFSRPPKYMIGSLILGIIALLLVACGGDTSGTQATPGPTVVPVNGFGPAANHVHSLVVLPPDVLVMATHYGLFRSQNGGTSWHEVAGGSNQLMEGLMTYSLISSTLNPQRLYVLTQPAVIPHTGTVGLYTSADEGRTWKLSIASASITSRTIFVVAPGNDTPDEVYVYLSELGPLGLKRSLDNGQHFTSTGTLPFGMIFGMLAIPGAPGHLLAFSSDGTAYSADGGIHWHVIKNITGSINEMTTAGPHSPIYASGDAGIYSSNDGGKTFQLVYTQASFASLTASPTQPQVIYGKTGTNVYRSDDGGHSWSALPHISGNLAKLSVDPMNALSVYLSLSYPTELFRFSQDSKDWLSLTPQT